jgi:hypothetical protein
MVEQKNLDNSETTREKGDALEKNVEFIFQSAGFETQRNIKLAKYEIDVLAKIGDRNVVIECKNYQSSNLTIRNLIHQWSSKNKIIKANKIIIVITGLNIKKSDHDLANKFDIELWNELDLTDLFNLSLKPTELRDQLLKKISFKPICISELYRDEIASIVIRPILGSFDEDEEETYKLLNHWLRSFIRTNLQIEGTNKGERIKHIELFEGTKEKKAFFNLLKVKRKEFEYWKKLGDRLKKEKVLDKKIQNNYYEIMQELLEEYKNQTEYYKIEDKEDKIRKLIMNRLYDALIMKNPICSFGFQMSNTVEVIPADEGKFLIRIKSINDKQANLINWILTSEYFFTNTPQNPLENIYSWYSSSLEETSEKVYRILEEFFDYEDYHDLRDYSLD